ncbi:transcription termination/antitermination protein NusG [Flavitalea sp.]|nr:UpxY family transcription antiterminator [Flavitalea sp.]
MTEKKKWFAIYTRHRWEKKVHRLLQEKGIETYCPLNKIERKWSDRLKTVEEPLFKSYVFVKVTEDEKTAVRMTNGVVNFVYWLGKPAVLKDREIDTIKKFLNEHDNVEVERFEILPNKKVQINSGVFMDKEATVISVSKNMVRVMIESLGFALIAKIDRIRISAIKK